MTDRLLAALRQHGTTATGFVVCGRDSDGQALRRWLAAGMDLGNHTNSHKDIDTMPPAAWEEDVLACQRHLERLGHLPRFFRFPMLHQGRLPARRDLALATLRRLGLANAPVTVDTADWVLVRAYAKALQTGDSKACHDIGAAYIAHVLAAIRHYRQVARARAGREVQHILLLHGSALAADHLAPLLAAIRREGLPFVSLTAALLDPVYQRPDDYAGPIGMSWLYRFRPAQPDAWRWDRDQQRALESRFGALLHSN